MEKKGHETRTGQYDDMLYLEHPTSRKHPRMPLSDRAAQFSSFAALSGHAEAMRETARLTDEKRELDDTVQASLDEKLQILAESLPLFSPITFVYFVKDEKKSGGAYRTSQGIVQKIDYYEQTILLANQEKIPIHDIIAMEGELFSSFFPK